MGRNILQLSAVTWDTWKLEQILLTTSLNPADPARSGKLIASWKVSTGL